MIRLATRPRLTAVIALLTVVPVLAPVAAVGAGSGTAATDAATGTDADASEHVYVGEIEPGGYTETTIYIGPDDTSWNVSDVYITGTDAGAFSVVSGGGSFSLDPGEDREMTIGFSADELGVKNATLVIEEEERDFEIPLSGEVVDDTSNGGDTMKSLSFAEVPVGETVTKTVTIPGVDDRDITVTASLIGTDADPFRIVDGGGTFTIPAGGEHDITVAFRPDEVGTATAQIELDPEDDRLETKYVDLSGEGVDGGSTEGNVTVSTETLDFPTVPVDRIGADVVVIRNNRSDAVDLTLSATTDGPGSIHFERTQFRVSANGQQLVPIVFVPGARERTTGEVTIEGSSLDEPLTVSVSGEGAPPLDPGRSIAFATRNQTILSSSVDGSVVAPVFLRNNASESIELSVGDLSSPFTVVLGGGTVSLEPGEIHAVFVQYDPTSEEPVTDELVVDRTGADETLTIELTGRIGDLDDVDPPQISLSAETVDFGTVPVGETARRTVTVRNDGSETIQVGAGNATGAFGVVDGDPVTVDPGETRDVVVEFSPGAAGQVSDTMTVVAGNQAGVVDREVRLVGEGTSDDPDVDVSLSATNVSFGTVTVGEETRRTLTVTNDGNETVELLVDGAAEPFAVLDPDPVTVAPGESAAFSLAFAPETVGEATDSVSVRADANGTVAERTVRVGGTGAPPEIDVSLSDETLEFGVVTVNETVERTLTVTNDGNGTVAVGVANASGPFEVVRGDSAPLEPGESREVTVRFAPGQAGPVSEPLTVLLDDGNREVERTVDLSGTGTNPDIAVSVADERLTADDPETTMTIANRGEGPLIVDELTFPGPFSADVDEPLRIPGGEERTVTVRFDASVDTNVTAGVRIESNDADQPVLRRTLRGIPESPNATVAVDGQVTDMERQVNATVTEIEEGSTVGIDTSTGTNESENVSVDGVSIAVEDEDEFSLNVTTSDDELDTTPEFNLSDGTDDVGYLRVNHSVPDENISSVSFTFTVPKSEIPRNATTGELEPEEMVLYRYVDGEWVALRTEPIGERDGAWQYRGFSPGLSEFAIGRQEPQFEINRAEINVTSAQVGDSVAIRVLITNTGGADGIFDVKLFENQDLVDREQPTVPPNSTVRIVFLRSYEEAGQYRIGVNNRTVDTVEVEPPETTTKDDTTDDDTPSDNTPSNDPQRTTTGKENAAGPTGPNDGGGDGGFPIAPLLAVGLLVTAGAGVVYRQLSAGDDAPEPPDDDPVPEVGGKSGSAVELSDDDGEWDKWDEWDEDDDGPPEGDDPTRGAGGGTEAAATVGSAGGGDAAAGGGADAAADGTAAGTDGQDGSAADGEAPPASADADEAADAPTDDEAADDPATNGGDGAAADAPDGTATGEGAAEDPSEDGTAEDSADDN